MTIRTPDVASSPSTTGALCVPVVCRPAKGMRSSAAVQGESRCKRPACDTDRTACCRREREDRNPFDEPDHLLLADSGYMCKALSRLRGVDPDQNGPLGNRKFANSPLEGDGFELPVPRRSLLRDEMDPPVGIRLPPRMFDGGPRPSVRAPASVTRFPGTGSGTCGTGSRSPWPPPFAPLPPRPVARPCSAASLLLWRSLTSHARASSASVPHLPDADQSALQPVAGHETSQVPTRSFRT